jgi:hypothetical protein
MYYDMCENEIPQLLINKFRINTFQVVLNQIKESLNRCFSVNKKLLADIHQFMYLRILLYKICQKML